MSSVLFSALPTGVDQRGRASVGGSPPGDAGSAVAFYWVTFLWQGKRAFPAAGRLLPNPAQRAGATTQPSRGAGT